MRRTSATKIFTGVDNPRSRMVWIGGGTEERYGKYERYIITVFFDVNIAPTAGCKSFPRVFTSPADVHAKITWYGSAETAQPHGGRWARWRLVLSNLRQLRELGPAGSMYRAHTASYGREGVRSQQQYSTMETPILLLIILCGAVRVRCYEMAVSFK